MMKVKFFVLFLLCTHLLQAQISNNNLLAYYPFDGDALDYGPSSFDGVINGATFGLDANGNPQSALLLDGINDFVNLSVFGSEFRNNLGQMTILFKIRFEAERDSQTILSLGTSGEGLLSNVFEIEYENDRLQVETETGTIGVNHEYEIDQSEEVFTGAWHSIMITLDGTNLKYCRDGEVIYQSEYIPTETISNDFFLGNFGGSIPNACCFLSGYIDDLQFYDRIFTEEDREYVCTPCVTLPNQLTVSEDFISGESAIRQASATITSTSDINANASAIFRAGELITLTSGFHAKAESNFLAYLVNCIDDTNYGVGSLAVDQPETTQESSPHESAYFNDLVVSPIHKYRLSAYPNPFSTSTNLSFTLEEADAITLKVFDLNGKLVKTLSDRTRYDAGDYQITFNNFDLPDGIYLAQFLTTKVSKVIQLVVAK